MSNLNGDNQQSTIKPTAAGCVIKATDSYSIISSLACFASFIVYGACNASLGASVPIISRTVYRSESYVGFSFITRGIGFLCSTVLSGLFLSIYDKSNWKEYYVCIFTLVMGIATVMIGYNKNYLLLLFLTVVQGIGYGVVDTVGNCLLPELWGIRVQPWMQFLHLCFGIGAIIGPSMIGYFGFKPSYLYIGIMSVFPLLFLLLSRIILPVKNEISDRISTGRRSMVSIDDDDDDATTTVNGDDDYDDNEKSMSDIDSGGDGNDLDHTVDYNIPVPTKLRILIATFYFIYTGTEASFGGWISVYAMNAGVTSDPSSAAYIATIFWLTLTIGRIIGVFTAIYLSATFMLRLHLLLTVVFSILVLMISGLSFTSCCIVSASMGLGVSAIYPLAMTVVSDYGYTMDSTSTTMFMLGAVFGEGVLPMVMGLVIAYCGPTGFPVGIVVSSSVLVLIYVAVDVVGGRGVSSSSSSIRISRGSSCGGGDDNDDAVPGVIYHSVTMNTLNDKQSSDIELID